MNSEARTEKPFEKGIVIHDGRYKVGGDFFSLTEAVSIMHVKNSRLRELPQESSLETFRAFSGYLDTILPQLMKKEVSLKSLIRSSQPTPSGPLILPR